MEKLMDLLPNQWYATVRELTLALVRIPSLTNSAGETHFARQLADRLVTWPYFARHPDQLRCQRTSNDAHERYNLYAFVRGASAQTIILAGHYDVVSIENYGALQAWAYDPEALLPRLIETLTLSDQPADRLALADLQSGDFLPGRGSLDMKSGLAAGLAVLQRAAASPDPLPYSLLFLATPDEEQASHGMRSAVRQLPELLGEWALAPVAAINLDSGTDEGDGREGQVVFMGSVGKLLPAVYIVGRETHAGLPFGGINATVLAAAVTRRIECNVRLTDTVAGETSPPPVCLKQTDLKAHYDVTTPTAAWSYYNLLTHGRSAALVFADFLAEVSAALDDMCAELQVRAGQYSLQSGQTIALPDVTPRVLTFDQLRAHALDHDPVGTTAALAAVEQQFAADPTVDRPDYSRRIYHALWQHSGLVGPAAVVGFAAVHYPAVYVGETNAGERRLRHVVEQQAAAVAQALQTPIKLRNFFPGISDMSFLGGNLPAADARLVNANTPPRLLQRAGSDPILSLNLPTVNIGPWGRDYHHCNERVHMPYSFGVLPELIWRVVCNL